MIQFRKGLTRPFSFLERLPQAFMTSPRSMALQSSAALMATNFWLVEASKSKRLLRAFLRNS